jgi:hypothetical protein
MLDSFDRFLRDGGYEQEPVRMFLAGGMAQHFYSGGRYTEDVDASFSHRLMVPAKDLTIDYVREDGSPATLYFDANYSDTFALMHPDHRKDSREWPGIGNERRLIQLYVLSPIDLALSKVSRFSEQDHADILVLAEHGLVDADELRARATEALEYYVGDTRWIQINLDELAREI